MSLTLSSADLDNLARATELLVSPLDHESLDDWRSAVNHHLRELVDADSAGFLLPVTEGLALYSDEHDPESLAAYPELPPPPIEDGTPAWTRMVQLGVATLETGYGASYPDYLSSAYYNEYAAPNGAGDTLAAGVPLPGAAAPGIASLQLWREFPVRRRFGQREVALLRLLYPAFRAGVESYLRWGREREGLLSTVDQLGRPALISDLSGEILHVTPGLEAILETDPDALLIRGGLRSAIQQVSAATRRGDSFARELPTSTAHVVRTRTGRYRITGFLYADATGRAPLAIVGLEHLPPAPPSGAELKERFGLTRRQAEVALLLAERLSNAEIAERLFISPHTALRHTEAVMSKLKIDDRRLVGDRLRSPSDARRASD